VVAQLVLFELGLSRECQVAAVGVRADADFRGVAALVPGQMIPLCKAFVAALPLADELPLLTEVEALVHLQIPLLREGLVAARVVAANGLRVEGGDPSSPPAPSCDPEMCSCSWRWIRRLLGPAAVRVDRNHDQSKCRWWMGHWT